MASFVPNGMKRELLAGAFVFGTTAMGAMLVTGYDGLEDPDHEFVSDVTGTAADELAGTGYARITSGAAFTGETVTKNDTDNRADVSMDKITFLSLAADNATPSHCILYDNTTGADGTRRIFAVLDLSTNPAPTGNNYEIQFDGVDGNGNIIEAS